MLDCPFSLCRKVFLCSDIFLYFLLSACFLWYSTRVSDANIITHALSSLYKSLAVDHLPFIFKYRHLSVNDYSITVVAYACLINIYKLMTVELA